MLANLNDVLIPAQKEKYAVGLFNTVNLEMARGVFAAAEENGSPIIIGSAEILLPFGPMEELSYFLLPMAKRAKGPVVVHFDHGLTKKACLKALELGFTSIMYDCSKLPYEENVKMVKEMADIAHSYGATIEGELGHVGDNEGSMEGADVLEHPEDFFTQPEIAADYAARTGIDALAIAVGNAHGAYKLPPKLDFKRITEIKNAVSVPLVLHGGSGLSDSDFKTAIDLGIAKVNIFTDINVAQAKAANEYTADPSKGMTYAIPYCVEAVKAQAANKMELFGSVKRY